MRITEDDVRPHLPEITRDIERLVARESPSESKELLDDCLDELVSLTLERLGTPDALERHEFARYGDVVAMRYAGDADTHVLLMGHYDTVWPAGTCDAWVPNDAPDEWSLTGIQDMKAGLVQGIWAVKLLRERRVRPTVTFIFNGDEELGSLASQKVTRGIARGADAAFVLEALENGAVKIGRKGIGNAVVTATGIEAHAGNAREEGASAIAALCEFCLAAERLNDAERGIGINVGRIVGGTGANTVPGSAQGLIDVRFLAPGDDARIERQLRSIRVSDPRVRIDIAVSWHRPAMPPSEANRRLYRVVRDQARALGRDLGAVTVGGASDANILADAGVAVVCGVGPVGEHSHARNEYVSRAALPFSVALLANSIGSLARSSG